MCGVVCGPSSHHKINRHENARGTVLRAGEKGGGGGKW